MKEGKLHLVAVVYFLCMLLASGLTERWEKFIEQPLSEGEVNFIMYSLPYVKADVKFCYENIF